MHVVVMEDHIWYNLNTVVRVNYAPDISTQNCFPLESLKCQGLIMHSCEICTCSICSCINNILLGVTEKTTGSPFQVDFRPYHGQNYSFWRVRNLLSKFNSYVFIYWPLTLCQARIYSRDEWTPGLAFCHSSASTYYTECKPYEQKQGRPGNQATTGYT